MLEGDGAGGRTKRRKRIYSREAGGNAAWRLVIGCLEGSIRSKHLLFPDDPTIWFAIPPI